MKRLVLLVVATVLMSVPAFAQAKSAKPAGAGEKALNATGEVSAVSPTALTVKSKAGDLSFVVDSKTHVSVSGATKKTAALKDSKEPTEITKFVKVGDSVTVKYHEMGGAKHAADVLVRTSVPAKK